MGVFIYTIKDRQTGEVLFVGREGVAAEYLGCARKHLYQLSKREGEPSTKSTFSHVAVSREWRDEPVYCKDCGEEMPGASPNRERCSECIAKRKRVLEKNHRRKKIAEAGGCQVQRISAQAELQQACIGCFYFGGENYINRTCNYIFIVGHSRGCPPGDGCTKRKEREKK